METNDLIDLISNSYSKHRDLICNNPLYCADGGAEGKRRRRDGHGHDGPARRPWFRGGDGPTLPAQQCLEPLGRRVPALPRPLLQGQPPWPPWAATAPAPATVDPAAITTAAIPTGSAQAAANQQNKESTVPPDNRYCRESDLSKRLRNTRLFSVGCGGGEGWSLWGHAFQLTHFCNGSCRWFRVTLCSHTGWEPDRYWISANLQHLAGGKTEAARGHVLGVSIRFSEGRRKENRMQIWGPGGGGGCS